jgi:hypothetical protein
MKARPTTGKIPAGGMHERTQGMRRLADRRGIASPGNVAITPERD